MKHGIIDAIFMRGGTSKALMFHERDLPADRHERDALFLAAMGSPDPYGRQLNGMGGGVTSLSKVCIIGPPSRPDADLDYTFVQVIVKEARVSYAGNCGNMSAAVGPFVIDEALLSVADAAGAMVATGEPDAAGRVLVRIHNTNTKKIIHSTFPVEAGRAAVDGALVIPGVAGSGAPIRLDFLEPGGAGTGRLLPSGRVVDFLDVDGLGVIEVSMVDAANPCVFLDAASVGLTATEMPQALEADAALMARLHAVGAAASVAMGRSASLAEALTNLPLIAVVAPARESVSLSGDIIAADAADLCIRMLSNGQPHRALPGTGSVCAAVAARIPGTIPHRLAQAGQSATHPPGARAVDARGAGNDGDSNGNGSGDGDGSGNGGPATRGANEPVRLAMPSGVIAVDAEVVWREAGWHAVRGSVFRTARRLFKGELYY